MTPMERAEQLWEHDNCISSAAIPKVAAAIQAAIEEEREACADLADQQIKAEKSDDCKWDDAWEGCADIIGTHIRARGAQPDHVTEATKAVTRRCPCGCGMPLMGARIPWKQAHQNVQYDARGNPIPEAP